MADNCLAVDSWSYRSSLPDTLWMAEAFARDDDAVLTRALHASLSAQPEPDIAAASKRIIRNQNPAPISAGKITKRKSRASKKSPTTYITADPANFRQMVQQVTGGVRFPIEPVFKPEPQRDGLNRGVLPTLDTSALLMQDAAYSYSATPSYGSVGPVGGGSGSASGSVFEFDTFSSFPTLESWSAM